MSSQIAYEWMDTNAARMRISWVGRRWWGSAHHGSGTRGNRISGGGVGMPHFLDLNGSAPELTHAAAFDVVMSAAEGVLDVEQIADRLNGSRSISPAERLLWPEPGRRC